MTTGLRSLGIMASDDDEIALNLRRCDHGFLRAEEGVHLGPHPELARQVDARLDREADAGHEAALLARLEVVEVRTGAVERTRIDRMAGAVEEAVAESARLDHVARRVVHVGAADGPPLLRGLLHQS